MAAVRRTLLGLEGGSFLNRIALSLGAGLALTLLAAGCGQTTHSVGTPHPHATKSNVAQAAAKPMQWGSPPRMTINAQDQYRATVHTTAGKFTMQLFASQDPVAVNNFVFLANQGFFNHDQFFRVVKSFVIQTGDPLNDGMGGPGYTWKAELPPPFPYQRGIVAMAVSGTKPNTNGSQFFICIGPKSAQLNQKPIYTELGRIVNGWSTLNRIAQAPVTHNPVTNEDSYPVHPISITSVTIQQTPSNNS